MTLVHIFSAFFVLEINTLRGEADAAMELMRKLENVSMVRLKGVGEKHTDLK